MRSFIVYIHFMLFFELLQVAIGNREMLTHTPTAEEWSELYTLAQRQTLVGIAFRAVEQLPEAQQPPKALLMQWMMATERIKALNTDLDRKALAVANKFLSEGFPSVILKGQGISKLYILRDNVNENDNCLLDGELSIFNSQFSIQEYRTPGDIDIWLHGERKDILNYVRRHVPDCKPVYHHVDFPVIEGLDIEVHFMSSWMNSPVTNHRLQRFFRESADALFMKSEDENSSYPLRSTNVPLVPLKEGQCEYREKSIQKELSPFKGDECSEAVRNVTEGVNVAVIGANSQEPKANCQQPYTELPVPNLAFNRIYILVHIYRHLFHEGIGLRQLLDYYFVLHQGFTEEEREETMRMLRSLKMERFTAAVMWVLQEVYGMDDRYLLTTPDEREGRFLLNEIMMAGNFGHYDERLQHEQGETTLHWALRKIKRNFRFVRSYPSEVLWSPLFKLWHWVWRKTI